ncbi:MAG: hypothetical protein M1839_000535 [Geoglossum umbratile]|nr:MAG: hypothetical protein M1839_000535 [Geoglossum umbratile]
MPSSTIRVFVHWTEQTVFAGEDVECRITFKNTAPVVGGAKPNTQNNQGFPAGGDRQRKTPWHGPVAGTRSSGALVSGASASPPRGHQPTLSLSVPPSPGRRHGSPGSSGAAPNGITERPRHKHHRSVSIIPIGGSRVGGSEGTKTNGVPPSGQRPSRGHTRSASLQIVPRGFGRSASPGTTPAPVVSRNIAQPSPLCNFMPQIYEPPDTIQNLPTRNNRRLSGASTAPATPTLPQTGRNASGSFSKNFRFPGSPLSQINQVQDLSLDTPLSPRSIPIAPRTHTPKLSEEPVGGLDPLPPVTRILSGSSVSGTPRSSGEFYSMSNNSTETLASEYMPQVSSRLLRQPHIRRTSNLAPTSNSSLPEALMMGYVQIMGSFTLDGSLISQAPFEEVKRKGVVGGQGGGGVVGVETSRRDNGLFGALGWGNIGESIGGLLGSGELSSIKQMRDIANSKTIPLITTQQSILFVNLQLAPGESKSYNYTFKLPKGLPPTHKGKAIKISYSLVIGTQRATKGKEQHVQQVELPFRVLGGVDARGEILGHDLMSPYIILKDKARTSSISSLTVGKKGSKQQDSSFEDFMSYVDSLLSKPHRNPVTGLLPPQLSPTATNHSRHGSIIEELSAKEAIDLAILRGSPSSASTRNTNRFEVARNGRRVAVLTLGRSAYRLGETVIAVIDFSNAEVPCYSLHAALETSERIDPSIALRSGASIYRVTRRTHGSHSESTLFARRVVFSPTIPVSATPEFITSGVSLGWKLKVEFVTPKISGDEEDEGGGGAPLLEEVQRDERGVILAAVEGIICESFEVTVPVRVYGAVVGGAVVKDESAETEGFAV